MAKKAKAKKVKPVRKTVSAKKPTSVKNSFGVMPLGDRVLVKPLAKEEGKMLPSGIIIPETVDKEKPEQGTVVAVGAGKRNEKGELMPMSVKVGDKVMFSKYGYDEVKVDGVEYFVISETSILAIISH